MNTDDRRLWDRRVRQNSAHHAAIHCLSSASWSRQVVYTNNNIPPAVLWRRASHLARTFRGDSTVQADCPLTTMATTVPALTDSRTCSAAIRHTTALAATLSIQPVAIYTQWSIKTCHFYFYDNFGRYGPVLIILSLMHSQINCGRSWNEKYHLTSNLLPHYLAKFDVQICNHSC